jgi:glucokinase
MFLGIDVGGSKVAAGLVDASGAVTEKFREPIDQSDDESAVRQLERIIQSYEDRASGIGIAVPGIADRKKRTVWAPNLVGWNHIPLVELLARVTSTPITLESDRIAAAQGEILHGCGRGRKHLIFLIIGTGIGAGIISDGQPLRGSNDIGGAVGWIPVSVRRQRRHFEDIASGPAIEHAAIALFHRATRLPELAELARRGNRAVQDLFEEAGEAIGVVAAMIVSIFNPEMIVIGGGVSACWDLLSRPALAEMRLWSQPVAVDQVEVAVSSLGEDAGIVGAAAAAAAELARTS